LSPTNWTLAERIAGADVQSLRQFVGQSPWAGEQIQQQLAEKMVDLLAELEVWTAVAIRHSLQSHIGFCCHHS